MVKRLTVLFAPINYVGPVLASVGMAEVLRDRGHKVVFAVRPEWTQKLRSLGFAVEVVGTDTPALETDGSAKDSAQHNADDNMSLMGNDSPLDKILESIGGFLGGQMAYAKEFEPYVREIVANIKPDVIISDHIINLPSIVSSGIPWIFSFSSNPLSLDLCLDDKRLPPSTLGLAINSDPNEWEEYRQQINEKKKEYWNEYKEWLVSNGCPPPTPYQYWTPSPFANIYMYPKELDYTDFRPLPDTYHSFDYFKRTGNEDTFDIPEPLRNKSGKLVYLSLGSMGSANVDLMKRLVSIVSKSEHRFIVSKGVFHDKYSLADNMWGERSVPQIKVLPIVDLMVTHGGNNSVTETMYFGKPMIVLPLFFDQFDNAQRVQEMGFGVRLNPHECSDKELLDAINSVLNDTIMAEKCKKASLRIRSEKSIEKINDLVESLVN